MSTNSSKAKKLFRAIKLIIKNPYLLNEVLDNEDEHKIQFINETKLENGFPEVSFKTLLERDISVSPFAFMDGGSLPTDLALLKILAEKLSAKTYFEIGTWRGESVANVASLVPECYSLNLSDEELLRRNLSQEYVNLHRHFSQENPKIKHLFGDSRSFDFEPYYGKIDLVFVDGDHHYDSVVKDTETAFKLVSKSGAIVWHDYGNSPESVRYNVARAIWQGCPNDKKNTLRAISNTLCAAYFPFDFPTSIRAYPGNPGDGFELTLKKR